MTPESLKTCPLHETPYGMWASGMNRECLHGRGSAKCIEISCPRFGTASALRVCCQDCTDRYAGDCHGCLYRGAVVWLDKSKIKVVTVEEKGLFDF